MLLRPLIFSMCFIVNFGALGLDNIFIGKVIAVDGHNVMTVADAKGNLRILSLAYISTPVRHEPYFEPVNKHLAAYIDKWFQFTVASYGRNAHVQPVLMRDMQQKSINSLMIKSGLAMVNMATNPPPALIDQAYKASSDRIGLWAEERKFNPLERVAVNAFDLAKMLSPEDKNGLVPYFKDKETMNAYPVVCAMAASGQNMPIALTAHVARKEGYSIKDNCDELINTLKSAK